MTCDDAQIALEKAARGWLSVEERQQLAEHVTRCPSCDRMQKLIAALGSTTELIPPARVDTVLTKARRRRFWNATMVLGTGLMLALASFLVLPWDRAIVVSLGGAIVLGWFVAGARAHRMRQERLASAPTLFLLRTELQDEIRSSRGYRTFAGGALLTAVAIWQWSAGATGIAAVLLGAGIVVFGFGVYLRVLVLPRLLSELDELGEA